MITPLENFFNFFIKKIPREKKTIKITVMKYLIYAFLVTEKLYRIGAKKQTSGRS